jgi:hypothetical protein
MMLSSRRDLTGGINRRITSTKATIKRHRRRRLQTPRFNRQWDCFYKYRVEDLRKEIKPDL